VIERQDLADEIMDWKSAGLIGSADISERQFTLLNLAPPDLL
jgi:hypothetical protein